MATVNARTTGVQPKSLRVGLVAVTKTYLLGASLSTGDVIQMIDVPKGTCPVYVSVNHSGLTSTGTMNVGDGIVAARYITNYLYSAGAVNTPINTNYVPYTYSLDDTIDITISAISVSALAGSVILTCVFSMDPTQV